MPWPRQEQQGRASMSMQPGYARWRMARPMEEQGVPVGVIHSNCAGPTENCRKDRAGIVKTKRENKLFILLRRQWLRKQAVDFCCLSSNSASNTCMFGRLLDFLYLSARIMTFLYISASVLTFPYLTQSQCHNKLHLPQHVLFFFFNFF